MHILYSFRRCPYAMRARMALQYTAIAVELREVVLKNKPPELLEISAKGTVPVLQTANAEVIDESLDIMRWALAQSDPDHWLAPDTDTLKHWLDINDGAFKQALDRYKYADRFPEHSAAHYRTQGEDFLSQLEQQLTEHEYILGNSVSMLDIAVFPFIRQFAHVDKAWFDQAPYPKLRAWLNKHLESSLFLSVMHKYPAWDKASQNAVVFPQQG